MCSWLVDLGVYVIDSSLPMLNLVFVMIVCLVCPIVDHLLSILANYEKIVLLYLPMSALLSGNRVQFSTFSAEMVPPYFEGFGLHFLFGPEATIKTVISANVSFVYLGLVLFRPPDKV